MARLGDIFRQHAVRLADDRPPRPRGMRMVIGVALITLAACSGESDSPTARNVAAGTDVGKTAPAASPAPAAPDGRTSRWLIGVDALKRGLDNPRLRILDTRREDEYLAAHIAGALHVDIDEWIKNSRRAGGLDDAPFWSDLLGSLGIARDSPVVIYDETVPNAARVWWILRYMGMDDVRLLDGSWRQWGRKFYPIESKPPQVARATFQPAFQKRLRMTREALAKALGSHGGRLVLVDARSRGEYKGQDAASSRAGHIPGAVHLEWKEVLDEGNHFLSPDRLRRQFGKLGIEPSETVVPYCQSGARSSVMAFALNLAGYPTVRHYYGGWLDWIAEKKTPVEGKTP